MKRKVLGTFIPASGYLVIGDPCFHVGEEGAQTVRVRKGGRWTVEAIMGKIGRWAGEHVIELIAKEHERDRPEHMLWCRTKKLFPVSFSGGASCAITDYAYRTGQGFEAVVTKCCCDSLEEVQSDANGVVVPVPACEEEVRAEATWYMEECRSGQGKPKCYRGAYVCEVHLFFAQEDPEGE